MNLQINGADIQIPQTINNITQLIDHLNLSSPVIIVELNDVILPKEEHEAANITEGDKVEFVQFVGGG